MDSGTVKTLADAAAQLVPALIQLASADPSQQRSPEDEAMIRQLRVAVASISGALMEIPRNPPPPLAFPRPDNVAQPPPQQPPPQPAYTA